MKLGILGVGRMGANMSRRLRSAGHDVILHDVNDDALASVTGEGFATTAILEELTAGERLVAYRSQLWPLVKV